MANSDAIKTENCPDNKGWFCYGQGKNSSLPTKSNDATAAIAAENAAPVAGVWSQNPGAPKRESITNGQGFRSGENAQNIWDKAAKLNMQTRPEEVDGESVEIENPAAPEESALFPDMPPLDPRSFSASFGSRGDGFPAENQTKTQAEGEIGQKRTPPKKTEEFMNSEAQERPANDNINILQNIINPQNFAEGQNPYLQNQQQIRVTDNLHDSGNMQIRGEATRPWQMHDWPDECVNPIYMTGFLRREIGKNIRVSLLSEGNKIEVTGEFAGMGVDYILLNMRDKTSVLCDLKSIKSIAILDA